MLRRVKQAGWKSQKTHSFNSQQDKQVIELSQELASQLGMKIRKPYVSSKGSKWGDVYLVKQKKNIFLSFGVELLSFIKKKTHSETKPKPSLGWYKFYLVVYLDNKERKVSFLAKALWTNIWVTNGK